MNNVSRKVVTDESELVKPHCALHLHAMLCSCSTTGLLGVKISDAAQL